MAIIGREHWVDIVIDHPQISRRHAFVEAVGENLWRFVDIGSSNGLWTGGERQPEILASPGDELQLGPVPFDWSKHLPLLRAEAQRPMGFVIGLAPDVDLVIDESGIAPRHARVIPEGNAALLVDLGAPEGLWVNGEPVCTKRISARDEVRLGTVPVDVFRLLYRKAHILPPAASEEREWEQPPAPDEITAGPRLPPSIEDYAVLPPGEIPGIAITPPPAGREEPPTIEISPPSHGNPTHDSDWSPEGFWSSGGGPQRMLAGFFRRVMERLFGKN
jgi:pSer/pThr/pTyr-binding forkhead associated (FHA) protein